ncbi:MAG: hypothetical protein LQ344_004544 [Seirophora lacunosa]|nr:MAG: hypothetical protein LQ344_004544 [Seirophora lacunosa]
MSFFGQNNQQQGTGFGGFGSTNNTSTGFGQPNTTNTGFGATSGTTGGGLFGTSNTNTTNSGFGGFGATASTASPFGGNASGFGTNTSSAGGMFGSNTATSGTSSGFGGFGNSNTNTGGGLFGGGGVSKPAFGSQQATGGSLFGGGTNTFGSSNNQTTTGFGGAPLSSALASNSAECQGTGSTPFQAFQEKEGGTGNQTNHFQSITFMQPYKNFSFEELRLADYNQGRRFGNGSGQAGAFGASTGFGGFGGQNTASGFGSNNQSTGLFGTQTTTAAPFGGSQTATSGFGSTNTGGLFGNSASKPGGVFGSASSQPASGGLFGNSNQSGGFGAQNNNAGTGFGSNQGGGGLFGNTGQQNNEQKSGFSFGQNNNASSGFGASGTTGFGANNTTNTGGGLFGNNQSSAPFGGGQQQQSSNPFGGFGNAQQNQNQPQTSTASGFGAFGGGDQQKSGGLFRNNTTASNTGTGLFGNANQTNQQNPTAGGGLFGNANNQQSGAGSLFGPKPATTGTGLFGSLNASSTGNTGGGLFGNNQNQNQQSQSGGLFGNANTQQQQKPGGIFGSSTGGGLFGSANNTNNQQQGSGSIFGGLGSTNQQQPSGGLFGTNNNNNSSLFGNNQQQQQGQQGNNPLQAPQAYSASIFDANPYGSRSIFDGLPPPPQQYTGPIATPIGQKNKSQKGAVLPQYRINPHVASRFVTPQKRQGYGFTYSTYGTPSSASSNMSTPGGMSSSLLAGSISRGLGKSLSTSNLRRSFDPDQESLLSPGAFSAGSSRFAGTGSLKKLTIDRSLRTDLFQRPPALPSTERNDQSRQPGILKKKVSFDASTVGGNGEAQPGPQADGVNGNDENAREGGKSQSPEQAPATSIQPNGLPTSPQSNGGPAQPETEEVRGNELAVISEDGNHESQPVENNRKAAQIPEHDPQPGKYYMVPSHEEIARMSSEQKKRVQDFRVGRENCGYVVFGQPVDLTTVPLDRIFGQIAQIELRSVTVYPEPKDKPARGKGLNVPSTIYLANSWPRNRFDKKGPRFQKHVQRLQNVHETEFVKYEKDTGTWIFKVQHFSTYALDYDDDEGDSFQSSTLSAPPDSPTPQTRLPRAGSTPMPRGSLHDSSILSSEISMSSSGPEDTFEFRRKKMVLPGAFEQAALSDEEIEPMNEVAEIDDSTRPFLEQRLAGPASKEGEPSDFPSMDCQNGSQDLVARDKQHLEMAGAFPQADGSHEQEKDMSRSLLGSMQLISGLESPGRLVFNDEGDWAEELRRTISPRKQDRQALRESQAHVMPASDRGNDTTPKIAPTGRQTGQPTFATTLDLMHSIFPEQQGRAKKGTSQRAGQGKAFQYPYHKTLTPNGDGGAQLRDDDQRWHNSFKPSWGPEATFLYAASENANPSKEAVTKPNTVMKDLSTNLVSEGRDVRFARFAETASLTPDSLSLQKTHTRITIDKGIPYAVPQKIPFKTIAASVKSGPREETLTWDLASLLFDDIDPGAFGSIPTQQQAAYEHRVRKDLVSNYWSSICLESAEKAVTSATSAEERALSYLSANALVKACQILIEAKDFRLATLVAQLPADQIMAEDMAGQIHEWRELCVLSEITEPIRALYEICAGNTCICEGKKGPIEDQAKTFVISQRFQLDWRRAFGLRLWFSIKAEEPLEAAIQLFNNAMRTDDPVKPTPPFAKDASQLLWTDGKATSREDIRWGLLKLFAASKNTLPDQSLANIVMPHNLVPNPVDFRFSFQLFHALAHLFPTATDRSKADQLAWDFASQLESQGEWLWSVFILLHLSQPEERQRALFNTLGRHAGSIPADETAFPFTHLVSDFKVPASWIWEAKALHARSALQDHPKEIQYLQQAGNWTEAHATLCQVVGPQCVIEQDHRTLTGLLEGFAQGGKQSIEDAWRKGGEVYESYVALVEAGTARHDAETVEKLLHALLELVDERKGKFGFEEGIAVREMAGEVADAVAKGGYEEDSSSQLLHLPLTPEQHRRHSAQMSLKRFQDAMAGGRNR